MPAHQVTGDLFASQYAVIGAYGEAAAVRHVGLLTAPSQLSPGCDAAVYQMGPPLSLNAPHATMSAHVIGWIDRLTVDQLRGIETWLQRIRTWLAGQPPLGQSPLAPLRDYIIHPPAIPHSDPAYLESELLIQDDQTGRSIYRFSCIGFVERCYAVGAQVKLIDHRALPTSSLDELRQIWRQVPSDDRLARRLIGRWGLHGEGPWPILLPGHLLHSLSRADHTSPYRPAPDDRFFPALPPLTG